MCIQNSHQLQASTNCSSVHFAHSMAATQASGRPKLENAIKILSSKNVDLYNQHDMTRPGRKHTGDRRNTQKDTGDRLTHRRQIDTQETDVQHKETDVDLLGALRLRCQDSHEAHWSTANDSSRSCIIWELLSHSVHLSARCTEPACIPHHSQYCQAQFIDAVSQSAMVVTGCDSQQHSRCPRVFSQCTIRGIDAALCCAAN